MTRESSAASTTVRDSSDIAVTLREISALGRPRAARIFVSAATPSYGSSVLNEFAVQPQTMTRALSHRLESLRVALVDAARAEPETIEIANPAGSRANSAAVETTRIPTHGKLVFAAASSRASTA